MEQVKNIEELVENLRTEVSERLVYFSDLFENDMREQDADDSAVQFVSKGYDYFMGASRQLDILTDNKLSLLSEEEDFLETRDFWKGAHDVLAISCGLSEKLPYEFLISVEKHLELLDEEEHGDSDEDDYI